MKRLTIIFVAAIGLGAYEQFSNPFSVAKRFFIGHIENRNDNLLNYRNDEQNYSMDLIKNPKKRISKASAAVALDSNKNKFIYAHNENKPMKVASLAKLMTLYLTIQKAQKNNSWNQSVDTSNPGLVKLSYDPELGGFKFKRGHKYTVRELYKAALIQSSNNAAIALGQWVAGNNKKFIQMMNAQAKAWHLNAHFVSSSGLENTDLKKFGYAQVGAKDAANMVTAKSMAEIADHVLSVYPQIINDSKKTSDKVDGQTLYNENGLLENKPFYEPSLHVDGLKTGYTEAAGLCLVATGKKPGKDRLITVVINDSSEFSDTAKLMKMVYKQANVFK